METRANYVLIGLFTLIALIAGAGFVYWFQHGGAGADRVEYKIVFPGSVSGLRPGSAVTFNGIRVGEVSDLSLDAANPSQVIATVAIAGNTPVRADTQIGLESQGLTGISAVSLRGGSPSLPVLGATGQVRPVLRADPRASQDVVQATREVLSRVDKIIADNEALLNSTLKNVDVVTATLARNSESFDHSMKNVQTITDTFARNSEKFDRIMAGLDNLTGGPNGKGDIQEAARSIRLLAENLDRRTVEITAGINRFTTAGAREFESLSGDAKRTLAELERTLRNFDRNPSRLLFGGGNAVPEYNGRR